MPSNKDILQATLEELFDKHQMLPRIRKEMANVTVFTEIIKANDILTQKQNLNNFAK